MDSFSSTDRGTAFGILYAEDFDDPEDLADDTAPHGIAPEPPPPALTQADLDAACAEAVRSARRDWETGHERACLDALGTLNSALANMREIAERSSLEVAEGTVNAILSIVCGLLPHFCAEHGPAEVRALLARLLPTFQSKARILVRVHPNLVAAVERDLARLDGESAAFVEVAAAPLEPGDVKVSWENGSMTRDSRLLQQAVEDALGELGLKKATEVPAKRRMAYAD